MDEIDEIFTRLISKIKTHERQKELSIDQEDTLLEAIEWLQNHQHPEGYWGYESVADTGLVLLTTTKDYKFSPSTNDWTAGPEW